MLRRSGIEGLCKDSSRGRAEMKIASRESGVGSRYSILRTRDTRFRDSGLETRDSRLGVSVKDVLAAASIDFSNRSHRD